MWHCLCTLFVWLSSSVIFLRLMHQKATCPISGANEAGGAENKRAASDLLRLFSPRVTVVVTARPSLFGYWI